MSSLLEATRGSVTVAGATRTFTLVGAAAPGDAKPLILVFHGSRQTGDKHRAFTGGVFDALAARGALVAYLDGFRGNWNDAHSPRPGASPPAVSTPSATPTAARWSSASPMRLPTCWRVRR